MLSEPLVVVAKLARLFDALQIRYLVGGSVARSVYGIPRATQDVDLVADVKLRHVAAIASGLAGDFAPNPTSPETQGAESPRPY